MRKRLILIVAAAMAFFGLTGSLAQAQTTGSQGTLGAGDLEAIAEAKADGQEKITLLIATEEGETAKAAAQIRNLGGTIQSRTGEVGFITAVVPIDRVKATTRLNSVEAVDVERIIPLDDPRPHASSPALPQTPPDASTPRTNPYMPLQDIGTDTFGAVPAHDGRGVKVAILDTGIDLGHEAFQTTSTGDQKIVDWVNAIPPGIGDGTWVKTEGRHQGTFEAAGQTWKAPSSGGPFAFGTLVENQEDLARGEVKGDLNRNHVIGETYGILQNRDTREVIVDLDMDRDFTNETPMRDFRFDRTFAYFGTDDPGTQIEERMAFTVDTRRSHYSTGSNAGSWLSIGISGNSHGSHVAGITAGHNLFGGTMAGAAPGAELISIKVCPTDGGCTNSAMAEGMIYAAEAGADVANMSVGGDEALNDGNGAVSLLYDRLARDFGMTMMISAGNSGPGANIVGSPSDARGVISVAAAVSKDTWLSNYGQPVDTDMALFSFSSQGPAIDGRMKPEISAPGSAISAIQPWLPGSPVPGVYTLPAGYAMYNGTSMSSPAAAGAVALLTGAYKAEFGNRPSPAAIRHALLSTADRMTSSTSHGQGAGLLNVNAAWDLLRQQVSPSVIEAEVPVNNVLSERLTPPGTGNGIYDREGVNAGDEYTRTYTLTRRSGPSGDVTFDLNWAGDTSAFSTANQIVLPLNQAVELPVAVSPGPGISSAILKIDNPATPGVDHITQNVVFGSPPTADTIEAEGTVPRGGNRSTLIRVEPGTQALRVDFEGGGTAPEAGQMRFKLYDPEGGTAHSMGGQHCYIPDTGSGCPPGPPESRSVIDPMPGVWEITVDAHRASSVQIAPWKLKATILKSSISPEEVSISVREPGSTQRNYTVTNEGAPLTGKLTGGDLTYQQDKSGTIKHQETISTSFEMPADTAEIRATLDSSTHSQAEVHMDLFRCETTCEAVAWSDWVDGELVTKLENPEAGNYRLDLIGFQIPEGSIPFDQNITAFVPGIGSIDVNDTDKLRQKGASWNASATIDYLKPLADWDLTGYLSLKTSSGDEIGESEFTVNLIPDAPVVTLTKTPPSTGTARNVTYEFTVSDPDAAASCQIDGGGWQACSSPHSIQGLKVGDHKFEVRAEDAAGFGEVTAHEFKINSQGPICPAIKLNMQLRNHKAARPSVRQVVNGVRVRAVTGREAIVTMRPFLRYQFRGKTKTVHLLKRTVAINKSRLFTFRIPPRMRQDIRKVRKELRRTPVTFGVNAQMRLKGSAPACNQRVKPGNLKTRIVVVPGKAAWR